MCSIKLPLHEYANWLLDLDGTVVDSSGHHAKAWEEALSTYARLPLDFDYAILAGMSTEKVLSTLTDTSSAMKQLITLTKRNAFQRLCKETPIKIMPGFDEFFNRLWLRGRTAYIVTGASPSYANKIMKDYDRIQIFNFTTIGTSKPSPVPWLKTVEDLKINPARTVIVEDSKVGLESAQASGMDYIHYGTPGYTWPEMWARL